MEPVYAENRIISVLPFKYWTVVVLVVTGPVVEVVINTILTPVLFIYI